VLTNFISVVPAHGLHILSDNTARGQDQISAMALDNGYSPGLTSPLEPVALIALKFRGLHDLVPEYRFHFSHLLIHMQTS